MVIVEKVESLINDIKKPNIIECMLLLEKKWKEICVKTNLIFKYIDSCSFYFISVEEDNRTGLVEYYKMPNLYVNENNGDVCWRLNISNRMKNYYFANKVRDYGFNIENVCFPIVKTNIRGIKIDKMYWTNDLCEFKKLQNISSEYNSVKFKLKNILDGF